MIAAALYAAAGAQVLDTLTFLDMISMLGPRAEANPLVVLVYGALGVGGAIFAKSSMLLLVSSIAVIVIPRRRRIGLVVLTLAVLAGALGAYTNLNTIALNS